MRIRVSAGIAVFVGIALLCSVGVVPAQQSLRATIATDTDVKSWDPPVDWTTEHYWILHNLYDPLVFRGPNHSTFEPKLAERWERLNDLTVRFHLRRNAKFHDGTDVTAEDVRHHFLRIKEGTRQQYIVQPEWQFFTDVVVRDRWTLDVMLPGPDSNILDLVAKTSGGVVSKAYVERVGLEGVHRAPLGSGPYKLKEWVRGERVLLEANSAHWGGKPEVDELGFRIIPEPSTRLAELLTGGVDMAFGLVERDEARITSRPNLRAQWAPTDRGWMLFTRERVNERYKGDPELDRKFATEDPRVRRAIELAINKYVLRDLVQKGGEAFRARLFQPIPEANPALWGRRANLYDPAAAQTLLREAGYKNGEPKLVFHASDHFPSGDVARAIAAMLRRVGFTVDLRLSDRNTFNTQVYFPRRTQELILLLLGGNTKPFFGLFSFHTKQAWAPSGYGGGRTDLDRLIDCAFHDVRENQRRLRCYHRAQEIIADERYVIGLFQESQLWGINTRFQYTPRFDSYLLGAEMKRGRQ
jgi:peptide/nickel transport system substrate-binding protein